MSLLFVSTISTSASSYFRHDVRLTSNKECGTVICVRYL